MAELKREYVVPLRRKTRFAPKWRRSKKAVSVLKDFIRKHMKTDNIIICEELNQKIWANGIKNPPGKVSIIALKKDFAGVEKTLVNLSQIGVDKYLDFYKKDEKSITDEKEENKKDEKSDVKEADVKEIKKSDNKEKENNNKSDEEKSDEEKEKQDNKKTDKEVKKDEQ